MLHRMLYPGACHCRNLEVRFESAKSPEDLGVRTDTCTFCAKHHARYATDPAGSLRVTVADPALLEHYRFGTKTADFLLCRACGVYIGATMPEASVGVLNVNVLDARAVFLALPLQTLDLDSETLDQRLARRRARWTPCVIDVSIDRRR